MKSSYFAAIFAGVLAFPAASKAAVLLLIDVSDFSSVTFTSTGASPSASSSSTQFNDGIVLAGFFKSAPASALINISGSLTTPGGYPAYTRLAGINVISGSDIDINLYINSGHPQSTVAQRFNTSFAAFVGDVTINMEDFADYLIPQGHGYLYAGYSNPVLIGEWQTVPEPAVWKTGLLFGGGLLIAHRLRRRRNCFSFPKEAIPSGV